MCKKTETIVKSNCLKALREEKLRTENVAEIHFFFLLTSQVQAAQAMW